VFLECSSPGCQVHAGLTYKRQQSSLRRVIAEAAARPRPESTAQMSGMRLQTAIRGLEIELDRTVLIDRWRQRSERVGSGRCSRVVQYAIIQERRIIMSRTRVLGGWKGAIKEKWWLLAEASCMATRIPRDNVNNVASKFPRYLLVSLNCRDSRHVNGGQEWLEEAPSHARKRQAFTVIGGRARIAFWRQTRFYRKARHHQFTR
jgi:hypothetical protein